MRQSMTGYASAQGFGHGLRWVWEARSVNGKGLDLRLRVPDWIDGLDQALRPIVVSEFSRGNVTVSLRVQSEQDAGSVALNETQLGLVLEALERVEADAMARGLTLAPSNAAAILGMRGVLEASVDTPDPDVLRKVLLGEAKPLIAALRAAREAEGVALKEILTAQIDTIAGLCAEARGQLDQRRAEQRQRLERALEQLADAEVDEARLVQELALIAVKADVAEELDRLDAHIASARDLISKPDAVGRKLDFLCQEFNREANTLCAKSQSAELTRIGLDLKTEIDRMREQVQNVE